MSGQKNFGDRNRSAYLKIYELNALCCQGVAFLQDLVRYLHRTVRAISASHLSKQSEQRAIKGIGLRIGSVGDMDDIFDNGIPTPALKNDGNDLNRNVPLPDKFTAASGVPATIFARSGMLLLLERITHE